MDRDWELVVIQTKSNESTPANCKSFDGGRITRQDNSVCQLSFELNLEIREKLLNVSLRCSSGLRVVSFSLEPDVLSWVTQSEELYICDVQSVPRYCNSTLRIRRKGKMTLCGIEWFIEEEELEKLLNVKRS